MDTSLKETALALDTLSLRDTGSNLGFGCAAASMCTERFRAESVSLKGG